MIRKLLTDIAVLIKSTFQKNKTAEEHQKKLQESWEYVLRHEHDLLRFEQIYLQEMKRNLDIPISKRRKPKNGNKKSKSKTKRV